MPAYEYARTCECGEREYKLLIGSIDGPIPTPEGDGWVRVYDLSIGAVKGAGLSPSRQIRSKRP